MKFLIFTDEEIDGDGEEEKLPSFESIVNGEDEYDQVWFGVLLYIDLVFCFITMWNFLFKLIGFVLQYNELFYYNVIFLV